MVRRSRYTEILPTEREVVAVVWNAIPVPSPISCETGSTGPSPGRVAAPAGPAKTAAEATASKKRMTRPTGAQFKPSPCRREIPGGLVLGGPAGRSARCLVDLRSRRRRLPSGPLHAVVDERRVGGLMHAEVLELDRAGEAFEEALAAA